jgi:hypothetical protein
MNRPLAFPLNAGVETSAPAEARASRFGTTKLILLDRSDLQPRATEFIACTFTTPA